MKLQAYTAELIGTGLLALTIFSTLLTPDLFVATPFAAATILFLMVSQLGGISGAHFNPAVTVALATVRKISLVDAAVYILAQVTGVFLAGLVVFGVFGQVPTPEAILSAPAAIAEVVGTFVLMFGILSVVYAVSPAGFQGFVISGSLLAGIMVAASFGGLAVLNPAIALGLGLTTPLYLLMPIVGSCVAVLIGHWLYKTDS